MRFCRFAVPALIAAAASLNGQTSTDRVFQFAHTEGAKNMAEIATAVRAIGDIKDLTLDTAEKTMTVHAPPDQIKLAEWMFTELDAPNPDSLAKHEYQIAGTDENTVHIYYLRTPASIQEFQEVAVAIRSIGDIRRVFTYNAPKALILRGTTDQIALADWLVSELDQSAHTSAVHEYRMTGGFIRGDSDVRVFYLAHASTPQDFQEVATAVRSVAQIRRVFTYNAPRAMVVRGQPEQIALADWLVNQLDTLNTGQPRQASAVYTYETPYRDYGPAIRVFFLNHVGGNQDLQNAASQVKAQTGIVVAFTCNTQRALILRGGTDQIELAEQLVKNVE